VIGGARVRAQLVLFDVAPEIRLPSGGPAGDRPTGTRSSILKTRAGLRWFRASFGNMAWRVRNSISVSIGLGGVGRAIDARLFRPSILMRAGTPSAGN